MAREVRTLFLSLQRFHPSIISDLLFAVVVLFLFRFPLPIDEMTMMPQLLHRWTIAAPRVLMLLLSCSSFWSSKTPMLVVQAIAPPHPDYLQHEESPYESLAAYRQRHNITFNYQPQHISPLHCRFLTEAQCAADDEAARVRIAQQKQSRQRQRNLQNDYTTQGTNIKVLALLVRFADHADRDLPPREYYDELFNGGQGDINPVGGLSEWFMTNSLGRYDGTFVEKALRSSKWKTQLENQAISADHILHLLYCLTHTHIPFTHVLVPNCLARLRSSNSHLRRSRLGHHPRNRRILLGQQLRTARRGRNARNVQSCTGRPLRLGLRFRSTRFPGLGLP